MAYLRAVIITDPNDPTRHAEFDNLFQIPITIDVEHHEIHEGDSFLAEHIESGTGFSLCFKVPAGTKRDHILLSWAAESKAEVSIFEGREWDASTGSLVTIRNRERNNGGASQLQEDQSTGSFIANSSVILNPGNIGLGCNAVGIEIKHFEVWSDKRATEHAMGHNEWVLENDEVYVFTFLSNDGAKGGQITLDFYEHTDE